MSVLPPAPTFLVLVQEAAAKRWCLRPNCTTCGSLDFRAALAALGGPVGSDLAAALEAVDIGQLTCERGWRDCLRLAMRHLPGFQQRRVLEAWLQRLPTADRWAAVSFTDVVLFYLVCHLSGGDLRRGWIEHGVALALRSRDASLVETLPIICPGRVVDEAEFVEVARTLAAERRIRQLLRRHGLA